MATRPIAKTSAFPPPRHHPDHRTEKNSPDSTLKNKRSNSHGDDDEDEYPSGRVILHFDYDCFYASVFENAEPALRGRPLGVQQKSILATCNYAARARGVRKLMLVSEALRAWLDPKRYEWSMVSERERVGRELRRGWSSRPGLRSPRCPSSLFPFPPPPKPIAPSSPKNPKTFNWSFDG